MAGSHQYSFDKMSEYYPSQRSSRRHDKRKHSERDSDRDYRHHDKGDEYRAHKKSHAQSFPISDSHRRAHSDTDKDNRRDPHPEAPRQSQSGSAGSQTRQGQWPSSLIPARQNLPPPPPPQDPNAQQKMAELQAKHPDICFDGFQFVPQFHSIPAEAIQSALGVNQDIYFQHTILNQMVRKISALSLERKKTIEILNQQAESDKVTLDDLSNKLNDYDAQLKAAEARAKDTAAAIQRLQDVHRRELEESVNKCGAIALEKDEVRKKSDMLEAELATVKAQLQAERDEKMAAQLESQKYCDEMLAMRLQKDELDKELSRLEEIKEAARVAGQDEIKGKVDTLFNAHNAHVLIHRDLTFIKSNYHESLFDAWEQVLNIKADELGEDNVDEGALISEILRGSEADDLAIAKALYSAEPTFDAEAGPSGSKSIEPTDPHPQEQPSGEADMTRVEEYTPDDPPIMAKTSQTGAIALMSPILEGETPSLSDTQADTGHESAVPPTLEESQGEQPQKDITATSQLEVPSPGSKVIDALEEDKTEDPAASDEAIDTQITETVEHDVSTSMKGLVEKPQEMMDSEAQIMSEIEAEMAATKGKDPKIPPITLKFPRTKAAAIKPPPPVPVKVPSSEDDEDTDDDDDVPLRTLRSHKKN